MAEFRRAARRRAWAVAASAAAHVAVFAVLAWRLGGAPELAEAPVMNVQLATLPHPKPRVSGRPISRPSRCPATRRGAGRACARRCGAGWGASMRT